MCAAAAEVPHIIFISCVFCFAAAIAALRRVWPQDARPQRRVAAAAPLPSAARKVYPAPVAAAVSAGTGGAAASSEFTAPALATAAAAMLPATAASATIAPSSNTAPETDEQLGYGKSQRLEPSVDVPFTEIRVDRPHLVGNQLFGHVAYHCRGALGEVCCYERQTRREKRQRGLYVSVD